MPEVPSGRTRSGSLAEEALRRGKRFRRRRRIVARGVAGVAVAGVSAGVALGVAVQPAKPAHIVKPRPAQAVTTTSSLALHGPRSHPPVTHHPAKQPRKPATQTKTS